MTTVAGVDLSLASTGLALVSNDGTDWSVESWAKLSTGRRGDDLHARYERLWRIRTDVVSYVDGADLVVVEGPAYGARGGSQHDRSWLWGSVVERFITCEVPVLVVPPTTRAKWATNNGRADKAAVMHAMTRMWPQWEPPLVGKMDDLADAVALASIGCQVLGLFEDVPKYRVDALFKLELSDAVRELAA